MRMHKHMQVCTPDLQSPVATLGAALDATPAPAPPEALAPEQGEVSAVHLPDLLQSPLLSVDFEGGDLPEELSFAPSAMSGPTESSPTNVFDRLYNNAFEHSDGNPGRRALANPQEAPAKVWAANIVSKDTVWVLLCRCNRWIVIQAAAVVRALLVLARHNIIGAPHPSDC